MIKYLKKIYNYFVLAVLLLCSVGISAQDIQLSQYFAAGTYLNPAFTGSEKCTKLSTSNRKQWGSIEGGYTTNMLTLEMPIARKKNSIGVQLISDLAGSGGLYSRSIKGLYSYGVPLSRKHVIVLGLDAAYTFRGADFSSFVFSDQMLRGNEGVPTVESPSFKNTSYFDFSAGALFYAEKYWVGIATHHLNQPNQSLIGQESKLPMKYSFHGGVKINIGHFKRSEPISLSPSVNYKAQADFDQLDFGVHYQYHRYVIGLWYRGLPIKSYKPGEPNNDAMAILIGYKEDKFRIGYSYDITISRLSSSSGGAHELTMAYVWCSKRGRPFRNLVSCPSF